MPYWIVPDEMINDPLLVEHVIQAMGLMPPNLLLRFSRVKSSIMSWHNYWDFDKTGDGDVTEAELPLCSRPECPAKSERSPSTSAPSPRTECATSSLESARLATRRVRAPNRYNIRDTSITVFHLC